MSIEIIHPCKCKPIVVDLLAALKWIADYSDDAEIVSKANAVIAKVAP